MKFKRDLKSVNMKNVNMKNVNMKKLFRRNQIIVTTLAVMIAAAGYLNYTGKKDLEAGNVISEAGMIDISDEDILMENQGILDTPGKYGEILSLDQDLDQIEEAESLAEGAAGIGQDMQQVAQAETVADQAGMEAGAQAGTAGDGTAQSTAQGGSQTGSAGDGTDAQTGYENPGEAILTSGMSVSDYIAGVQLSREQVRAKNKDTLLSIINNTSSEEAAKQQAIQDKILLTAVAEKDTAS